MGYLLGSESHPFAFQHSGGAGFDSASPRVCRLVLLPRRAKISWAFRRQRAAKNVGNHDLARGHGHVCNNGWSRATVRGAHSLFLVPGFRRALGEFGDYRSHDGHARHALQWSGIRRKGVPHFHAGDGIRPAAIGRRVVFPRPKNFALIRTQQFVRSLLAWSLLVLICFFAL